MADTFAERPGALAPSTTSARLSEPPKRIDGSLWFAIAAINLITLARMWPSRAIIDFRSSYCAGRLAIYAPDHIYDVAAQLNQQRFLPGQGVWWLPFNHPPLELLIFAPLAHLPYRISLALWTFLSVALVLLATRLLSAVVRIPWWQLTLLALALFPTGLAVYEAQDTPLLLALLSATLYLLMIEQESAAGVILALALFKPQIPLMIALALLLLGRRKCFAAFSAAGGILALGSLAYLRLGGLRQWLAILQSQELLEEAWRMPNLRGLLGLVHAPAASNLILSIAALAAFFLRLHRSKVALGPAFASAILVGTLISYHFHVYDLAVLLIPFAVLLASGVSRPQLAAMLAIAASPVFAMLFAIKCIALLAVPVMVLACYPFPRRADEKSFAQ